MKIQEEKAEEEARKLVEAKKEELKARAIEAKEAADSKKRKESEEDAAAMLQATTLVIQLGDILKNMQETAHNNDFKQKAISYLLESWSAKKQRGEAKVKDEVDVESEDGKRGNHTFEDSNCLYRETCVIYSRNSFSW